MKKIKFLFIALVLILSLNSKVVCVYAQETKTKEDKEKEEIITLINECLSDIEQRINNIDLKIQNVKKQEEFEYYPAIRLNVDSPILGLGSVLENRLRVKRDISTSDVAARYSIRDILNNNTIKLPEAYLGSIIVSTKEISIDDTMELAEAKLTLVKCIQYLSQVNSAEDFVDNQINNIFRDYIKAEKKNSINEIKNRNKNLEKNLVEIAKNIAILTFLNQDTTEYRNQYNTISKELYEISKEAKNTLILESELTELTKKSVNLEAEILDLKDDVSKLYNDNLKDIDYSKFLANVSKNIETRTNAVELYVDNATTEIVEKVDGEEVVTTIVNYNVTSNATLDYMKLTLEEIQTEKDEYDAKVKEEKEALKNNENQKDKEVEETQEEVLTEEGLKQAEEKLIEENRNKVEQIYSKYEEFLSREYRFYTNNINMLLKDSNDKISSIIAEIDSGIYIENEIFDYTKYIYIDLPENLTEYINVNDLDSILEMNNLIKLLKKELEQLSTKNMEITKMYDNMITDILKS